MGSVPHETATVAKFMAEEKEIRLWVHSSWLPDGLLTVQDIYYLWIRNSTGILRT